MAESQKINKRVQYVSCIKLNGKPILPPIVTSDLRNEISLYKQQAIQLETEIKNYKKNKVINQHFTERPVSQLTFGDDSHIDALGINSTSNSVCKNILTKDLTSNAKLKILSKNTTKLNKNVLEVAEYTNNNLSIILDHNIVLNNNKKVQENDKTATLYLQQKPTEENEQHNQDVFGDKNINLIRRNSYTLEKPSPILLAHLRENSFDLPRLKSRNSIESEFASNSSDELNNSGNNNHCNTKTENSSPASEHDSQKKLKSPAMEVIQTHISLQKLTRKNCEEVQICQNKHNYYFAQNQFDIIDDDDIPEELKDVRDNCEIQIVETSNLKINHDNIVIANNDNITYFEESEHAMTENDKISSVTLISPSQSICYSVSDSSNTFTRTSPTANIINLENEVFPILPEISYRIGTCPDNKSQSSNLTNVTDKIMKLTNSSETVLRQKKDSSESSSLQYSSNLSVSRELFPASNNNNKPMSILRNEWAASVINAHVKGYLVRRLLKTEKVQGIIETIKDALTCALNLHGVKDINEQDVELHRRLIQQVSAACLVFYELFFEISIQEQMQIIALDRQKKLDRAKKVHSLRSTRSNFHRSTIGSISSTTFSHNVSEN